MRIIVLTIFFISLSFSLTLQEAIDKAKPYSIIKLSDATYSGNITINKALTIEGNNNSIIKGDGKSTVITITSDNVTIINITIVNSGNRIDKLDSAIYLQKVNNFVLKNSKIKDCLYGINFYLSNNCTINNNYITSKTNDIELRGDGLKIWYSNNNIIKNNIIENTKDVSLSYASNNKIINNQFLGNRFATQMELSKNNTVKNNIYKYNSVSLLLQGAKDTKILNNQILSSNGAAGIGIVIMGGKNLVFKNNKISFNAKAFYIDTKGNENSMNRYFINNEISYNMEALHFHASIKNNTFKDNTIFANIDDIVQDLYTPFKNTNIIEYNFWDRYGGFDKNKDGIGDNYYKKYIYADFLWQYNPKVKFYHSSPVLTLLDFLYKIAPFSQPKLLLIDTKPRMHK